MNDIKTKPSHSYNATMDMMKFICCLCVVCIHVRNDYTIYIDPLIRTAVPFFFMVSGYYLYHNYNKERIYRSIIKLFKYIVYSSLLYFGVKCFYAFRCDYSPFDIFTPHRIVYFLLFNENPICYHLWYLSAYLYVLLLFSISKMRDFVKSRELAIILIMLSVNVIFGTYSCLVNGEKLSVEYTRNWIFLGIPFFLLGGISKKILSKSLFVKKHFSVILFTIILSYVEYLICLKIGCKGDLFLTTPLVCLAMMNICINTKSNENFISKCGKIIHYLYILHPIVYVFLMDNLGAFMVGNSICVFIVSILISASIRYVNKWTNKKVLYNDNNNYTLL